MGADVWGVANQKLPPPLIPAKAGIHRGVGLIPKPDISPEAYFGRF